MMRQADVVVVGAGAVGAWCALSLARSGRSVLVLEERAMSATRASYGNAGLVSVSAAAPLATPGIMVKALRWSLKPGAPVRIRPRLSADWATWTWHFRRACRPDRVAQSTALSLRLVRRSAVLLDELARGSDSGFSYRRAGLVACFLDERAFVVALSGVEEYQSVGIEARPLDGDAARAASPLVGPDVVGGILYPEDASLDPEAMVRATLAEATKRGAEVLVGVRAERLTHGGRVRAILETSAGPIDAETIVVSAGCGSGELLGTVGFSALIEPAKGYSDDLALASPLLGPSLRLTEARIVASPLGDRLRVTSRLELGDGTETVRQARSDRSLRIARRYIDPTTVRQRVRAPWTGLRPLTPDGLPLVGRHPLTSNVVVASGHGHLGISHAPATGELVAQIVAGQEADDLEALAPTRFGRVSIRRT